MIITNHDIAVLCRFEPPTLISPQVEKYLEMFVLEDQKESTPEDRKESIPKDMKESTMEDKESAPEDKKDATPEDKKSLPWRTRSLPRVHECIQLQNFDFHVEWELRVSHCLP